MILLILSLIYIAMCSVISIIHFKKEWVIRMLNMLFAGKPTAYIILLALSIVVVGGILIIDPSDGWQILAVGLCMNCLTLVINKVATTSLEWEASIKTGWLVDLYKIEL